MDAIAMNHSLFFVAIAASFLVPQQATGRPCRCSDLTEILRQARFELKLLQTYQNLAYVWNYVDGSSQVSSGDGNYGLSPEDIEALRQAGITVPKQPNAVTIENVAKLKSLGERLANGLVPSPYNTLLDLAVEAAAENPDSAPPSPEEIAGMLLLQVEAQERSASDNKLHKFSGKIEVDGDNRLPTIESKTKSTNYVPNGRVFSREIPVAVEVENFERIIFNPNQLFLSDVAAQREYARLNGQAKLERRLDFIKKPVIPGDFIKYDSARSSKHSPDYDARKKYEDYYRSRGIDLCAISNFDVISNSSVPNCDEENLSTLQHELRHQRECQKVGFFAYANDQSRSKASEEEVDAHKISFRNKLLNISQILATDIEFKLKGETGYYLSNDAGSKDYFHFITPETNASALQLEYDPAAGVGVAPGSNQGIDYSNDNFSLFWLNMKFKTPFMTTLPATVDKCNVVGNALVTANHGVQVRWYDGALRLSYLSIASDKSWNFPISCPDGSGRWQARDQYMGQTPAWGDKSDPWPELSVNTPLQAGGEEIDVGYSRTQNISEFTMVCKSP